MGRVRDRSAAVRDQLRAALRAELRGVGNALAAGRALRLPKAGPALTAIARAGVVHGPAPRTTNSRAAAGGPREPGPHGAGERLDAGPGPLGKVVEHVLADRSQLLRHVAADGRQVA